MTIMKHREKPQRDEEAEYEWQKNLLLTAAKNLKLPKSLVECSLKRMRAGIKKYGVGEWKNLDLIEEISNEVSDLVNYSLYAHSDGQDVDADLLIAFAAGAWSVLHPDEIV